MIPQPERRANPEEKIQNLLDFVDLGETEIDPRWRERKPLEDVARELTAQLPEQRAAATFLPRWELVERIQALHEHPLVVLKETGELAFSAEEGKRPAKEDQVRRWIGDQVVGALWDLRHQERRRGRAGARDAQPLAVLNERGGFAVAADEMIRRRLGLRDADAREADEVLGALAEDVADWMSNSPDAAERIGLDQRRVSERSEGVEDDVRVAMREQAHSLRKSVQSMLQNARRARALQESERVEELEDHAG